MTSSLATAVLFSGYLAASAMASDLMQPAQQNALVQKYCAVCHLDRARAGGLSLEHFDASHAAPSLLAMMLSKLSGGLSLETVRAVGSDAAAAALLAQRSKHGAMGASGVVIPDQATIDSLIHAFAVESKGATEWSFDDSKDATASILREQPLGKNTGDSRAYRLIVSCDTMKREGSVYLTWSPVPQIGTLTASVDGKTPISYPVAGDEEIGKTGAVVNPAVASLTLVDTPRNLAGTGARLPVESLTIRGLFPGETVVFPFADLPKRARSTFEACFSGQH